MSTLGVAWTYNCSNALVGSLTEDWWRVERGTQGPALALASILSSNITFSAPVTSIRRLPSGKSALMSAQGELLARNVLIAGLSPPVYAAISQEPPLSADDFQLLSRLSLGTSLKYMVVYASPWWRHQGFLGKIVNTVYGLHVYMSECIDDSPADWSQGVMMCFIEGTQNREFFQSLPSAAERQAYVARFIGDQFQNHSAAADVLRVIEHNWADFPFTRGAYAPFFSPGVLSGFWDTWQSFVGHNGSQARERLWIAGADYSGNGLGYIDGAIKSGRSAANLIIQQALRD